MSLLYREFKDESPRVIDQQLKESEFYGIVSKVIYPELPPHSEYSITELGRSLVPIIDQIEK